MTCGTGVIKRDIVCMKKLGPVMAVVSDGNCLHQDEPEKEKPCQRSQCEADWYMTDWTQVGERAGCLGNTAQSYSKSEMNIFGNVKIVLIFRSCFIYLSQVLEEGSGCLSTVICNIN